MLLASSVLGLNFLALPTAEAAAVPSAEYVPLHLTPMPGDSGTYANAVNDAGTVVGQSGRRPVRWDRDDRVSALPLPRGYTGGSPTSVNDSGEIGGNVYLGDWESLHPVRWNRAGRVEELPLPPGAISSAGAVINARGSVMGNAMTPDYRYHAARWDARGRLVTLEALDGGESQAVAINDRDEMAGIARDTSGYLVGVKWSADGKITKLPPPEGYYPLSVNNRGSILGTTIVWDRRGHVTRLGTDPSLQGASGAKLNDHDEVLGQGRDLNQRARCVRWDRLGRIAVLGSLPQDAESRCSDLNNAGMVVGESSRANPGERNPLPVYWDRRGTITALPLPPDLPDTFEAQHVSERGNVIIGIGYDGASSTYRGVVWRRR
ncbi:hypothetical protein ACFWY9_16360 [Amycolatopsis sp. NPDC059027]|uniref:hypothetical protein n=1 Tax=unclassified Amycolatopsis TaxID=2618356 RepID=UPI00366C74C4